MEPEFTATNAAQVLYLPWLKAKIDSLAKPQHGFVPHGTPRRLHKITARPERKAAALRLGLERFRHIAAGGTYKTFLTGDAEVVD
jgi:hypothetical protein